MSAPTRLVRGVSSARALVALACASLLACEPRPAAPRARSVRPRPGSVEGPQAASANAPSVTPARGTESAAAPRSALVVTIDTARADRFGAYGRAGARTPAFDALASRGVRFERATTPTPLTVPAHTTLFTGLHPAVHGAEVNAPPPPPREGATPPAQLAEDFRASGARTAAFVASGVLALESAGLRGFDVYDAPGRDVLELPASERVAQALAWVDGLAGAPFFLWVHFMEPHAPHVAPAGSAHDLDPYDAELAAVDAALGALLEGLGTRGVAERLVVVVAGDHGEGLGDHGEREHGVFLYDEAIRVPLAVHATPELAGGRLVVAPVTLADVAPTLRALCGLPPREGDGVPLLAPPDARDLVAQSVYPGRLLGWAPLYALQRGTLVYIEAPRPELYDLAMDPGERADLLATRPEAAHDLAAALSAALTGFAARRVAGPPAEPPEASRARLGALGYATFAGASGAPGAASNDPKDRIAAYEAQRAARGVGRPRGPASAPPR